MVIFEYFDYHAQIQLQAVSRRFYHVYCPILVQRVRLSAQGTAAMSVAVFPQQTFINILAPSERPDSLCAWIKKPFKLSPRIAFNNDEYDRVRFYNFG